MKLQSYTITQGRERAGARSMLKAIGFTDEDLKKPIIGVANTWIETMPCNYNLRELAVKVKEGIREAGGTPMEFNTIAISDGVTMGTEGMKASLVSREIIADSVELMVRGHMFDGIVALVACDKTIPGAAMGMLRVNVPGVILYGGTILPGKHNGHDISIQDVFEAMGANARGLMSDAELLDIEDHACPGAGACGGQFTANTMATVMEMIGLSPLGTAAIPQVDARKDDVARRCGRIIMDAVRNNRRVRDICTRKAFENAIAAVAGSAGSTNAVLHLLAMAREAEVPLTIDDFEKICARTPVFVDIKPAGRFMAADIDKAGGIAVIAKRLVDAKLVFVPHRGGHVGRDRVRALQVLQAQARHAEGVVEQLAVAAAQARDRRQAAFVAASRQLQVEHVEERAQRLVQAPLLVDRPAQHVQRALVIRRLRIAVQHGPVGGLGARVVAHREQHLAAAELRFVPIAGLRILLHQPVERLQRGLHLAALFLRARQLVEHAVVARILREVLQVFLVLLDGGAIVGLGSARRCPGGVHVGQIHFQVAEAPHRLGALRIVGRRLQEIAIGGNRAFLAAGDVLVRHHLDLAAFEGLQRRQLVGRLRGGRTCAQDARAQPGDALGPPPWQPMRAKVHGPCAPSVGPASPVLPRLARS